MEVVYERCCGLDIHKKRIVACVIVPGPAGVPTKEIRTCGGWSPVKRCKSPPWLTLLVVVSDPLLFAVRGW